MSKETSVINPRISAVPVNRHAASSDRIMNNSSLVTRRTESPEIPMISKTLGKRSINVPRDGITFVENVRVRGHKVDATVLLKDVSVSDVWNAANDFPLYTDMFNELTTGKIENMGTVGNAALTDVGFTGAISSSIPLLKRMPGFVQKLLAAPKYYTLSFTADEDAKILRYELNKEKFHRGMVKLKGELHLVPGKDPADTQMKLDVEMSTGMFHQDFFGKILVASLLAKNTIKGYYKGSCFHKSLRLGNTIEN